MLGMKPRTAACKAEILALHHSNGHFITYVFMFVFILCFCTASKCIIYNFSHF